VGKSGSAKIEITDYRMSIHYGICHGPVDSIEGIYVGEKEAWSGSVSTESAIAINRPDLFGGQKKEGGLVGYAHYLPGDSNQKLPAYLASKVGLTPDTAPGYRGLASVWFSGGASGIQGTGEPILWGLYFPATFQGFMWGTNNPYLRDIWMKVKRSPKVLSTSLRMIGDDANPAAIIYECLVNTAWGAGMSPSLINTSAFVSAAQQLAAEGFGMSLQWTRQSEIETFVSEVLDHIQATLFINPRDGLMTLKLIRNDYDADALPVLDPDNCTVSSFDRKAWGETVNEIVVTWTNPENEQEETVTAQNLANIVIQGATISDSRNYYGVRNRDLALRLAQRDLALSSSPLAAFEIEVNRSAWNFVPGGCVKLVYPEYGIDGLILRIAQIDYGKPGDAVIKISATEDLFSLPASAFEDPETSAWVNPATPPSPLDFVRLITAPGFFMSAALAQAEADTLDYPEVFAAMLASSNIDDTVDYQLIGQVTQPNGEVVGDLAGVKPLLGYAQLIEPLPAAALSTVLSFGVVTGGLGPRSAAFIFIGNQPEGGQEIALIQSIDDNGFNLKRGVLDTVPRDWPTGTPCWFLSVNTNFIDTNNIHSAGESVVYKMLPTTSKGTLSIDEAPLSGVVLTGRPYLPNRPANVAVAGASFGTIDISASNPTLVPVAWAIRNRTMEDSQVLGWTDGSMTPEPGQTTTVRVIDINGTTLATHDGLTGTSFSVPIASFGDRAVADVRVTSKRDGLESLQGHTVRVKVRPNGWGDNWGDNWGGTNDDPPPGDPDPSPPGAEYQPAPGYQFPPFPWGFFFIY